MGVCNNAMLLNNIENQSDKQTGTSPPKYIFFHIDGNIHPLNNIYMVINNEIISICKKNKKTAKCNSLVGTKF